MVCKQNPKKNIGFVPHGLRSEPGPESVSFKKFRYFLGKGPVMPVVATSLVLAHDFPNIQSP